MKYSNAPAFRHALEHRLKSRAAGDGAGLARDRKRVAFDRLLARLLSVAPGQWLLKGGFALDLRLVDRARATKDIDIDWQDGRDTLLEALIDASDFDEGDFFTFTIERIDISEDRLGGSHRFRVTASLALQLGSVFGEPHQLAGSATTACRAAHWLSVSWPALASWGAQRPTAMRSSISSQPEHGRDLADGCAA
jgi:hypothetical protein